MLKPKASAIVPVHPDLLINPSLTSSQAHALSGKLIKAEVLVADSGFLCSTAKKPVYNLKGTPQHLNSNGRRLRHDRRLLVV